MPVPQKIVFLDIDGTLTSGFNHIPLSARKACRKARENGHFLYIASGRSREQISPSILSAGFDGIISSSGARIETLGRVIFSAFLSSNLLRRILEYFDTKKTPYMLELPARIIANPLYFSSLGDVPFKWTPKGIAARAFIRFLQSRFEPWDEDFNREQVHKVVFNETENFCFADVEKEFHGECEMFQYSIPVAFLKGGGEITPPGVNKGSAVKKVMEFHGIRREDTIALGDSDNDRPMLEQAGTGIAMGNGDESIKRAADDVTSCVKHGGLAKSFMKYGLV